MPRALSFLLSIVLLSVAASANASTHPVAYVYDGPGACDGCARDLVLALRKSGLSAHALSPKHLDRLSDPGVVLYAIPGGDFEKKVIHALGKDGVRTIRRFVEDGGRYLGVCLGAFVAAPKLANAKGTRGLALFDGQIVNHSLTPKARIEWVQWLGQSHAFYFQDGPQFEPSAGLKVQIWGRFADKGLAAVQTHFGKGRVGLLSIHPEATDEWLHEDHLTDPDGTDFRHFHQFVTALLK